MTVRFLLTGFILFLSYISFAQDKIENEKKIKADLVPQKATSFIENNILSSFNTKARWFIENNEKGVFYECKLKVAKEFNSIKFDSIGNIYDIEIIINLKTQAPKVYDSISTAFKKHFKSYKIEKVQIQYKGDVAALSKLYQPAYIGNKYKTVRDLVTRFEVEVKGKKSGTVKAYEYLFDPGGKLISSRKVIYKSSDHLNY